MAPAMSVQIRWMRLEKKPRVSQMYPRPSVTTMAIRLSGHIANFDPRGGTAGFLVIPAERRGVSGLAWGGRRGRGCCGGGLCGSGWCRVSARGGRRRGLGRGGRAALAGDPHDFFNAGGAVDGLAQGRLLDGGQAALAELDLEAFPVAGLDEVALGLADGEDLEDALLADVAHAAADRADLGLVLDEELPA